jgi:hypothetical protein
MTKKNENAGSRLKNSYEARYTMTGDSYNPIPERDMQDIQKKFIPPQGGTAARTLQLKTVQPGKDKK